MISIKEIQLSTQYSIDFVYGNIILNDTSEPISDYKFDLYRSNNANDAYELIQPDVSDLSFLDYAINLRTLSEQYYYKVLVTHRITGDSAWSNVYHLQGSTPDNEAYYFVEVYKMYLERAINNHKIILLSRKHTGQRCPVCFDEVRGRSQSSNCQTCFNTGYTGGYYKPQIIQTVFLNSTNHIQDATPYGVGEKKVPISLWTSNLPLIQIDDILIDIYNNRYVVTAWQASYKNSFLIRQTIQAMMVQKNSVVYDIPVNIDLSKV